MWILTPLQPGGETHYLLSSKEYVVGRKNCDILLPSDQSISRAHAHLTATDQTLTLKDTSKYGTSVNGQRVAENTTVNLASGNSITFGVFQSKFSVEHLQPVVSSSCLDNDGKASLSQSLQHVGGKLVPTWTQDCTHLVMSTVKVTIKTISALLCCRPIVKPEFFSALHTAIQQKTMPPEAERFIPEIDEPSLNKEEVNVGVILKRKQLFTGKTFVFLSAKQMKRLSAAVGFGGGQCKLLDEGSLPRDLLESPQTCVIDFTTGSSQTLLSPSATEWANSVKNIVEKKGLRVITESEIGLAAIYASCDKHCNSSSTDLDSVPKVKARIPSASLSQSVAVDETVLPAPSLNITAYAVNTELSQGVDIREISGVTAVGETPEKKPNKKNPVPNLETEKKMDTPFFVSKSLNSSCNTVESKRKMDDAKMADGDSGAMRCQTPFQKPNGGTKTFSPKQSPLKCRTFAQGSPQKQASLTSFFQPVSKKRPLEDDISPEKSDAKRPACDSSLNSQTVKETPTHSQKGCADSSQTSPGLAQNKAQGQKRKEMEEEIEQDELESIMSMDMDCLDEPPSRSQTKVNGSKQQKQVKTETLSKRQKLRLQDDKDSIQSQPSNMEKPSTSSKIQDIKEQNISINIDTFQHTENSSENKRPNKPTAKPSADKKQNRQPFEDNGSTMVDDLELLKAEATEVSVKPASVKQEVQQSRIEEDLPKKLLLVEFRDLKMTEAPPRKVPQQKQSNGYTKNFKCFRKVQMCGSAPVIRGADLSAHNRGKNSDLDEWLRDVEEEELQNRRDESVGDDLFRYNPSKVSKRR